MKSSIRLFLLLLLIQNSQLTAQTPSACPTNDTPAADFCTDACIYCNFNGYSGTIGGYTGSQASGFCGTLENDQWLAFVAVSPMVTITATATNCILGNGVQIALYSDCNGVPVLNGCYMGCAGCASTPASIAPTLSPGQTYYLVIDGYAGDECEFTLNASPVFAVNSCEGQPQFCPFPTAAPSDICTDACAYCELNGKTGSTIGYSGQAITGFCGTVENDQWLGFYATTNVVSITITPSNCSNGEGLEVALLEECDMSPLVCNNGQCCGGTDPITITANVTLNEDYFLVIDGDNGDQCDFIITVSPPDALVSCPSQSVFCNSNGDPAADDCATACIYCNLNGKVSTNAGGTASTETPGFCSTMENDVWFGFTANTTSATFTVTPQNCTTGNGLQLALFTECGFAPMVCNAGSVGGATTPRSVTASLAPDEVYYLMVDGYEGDVCDFTIAVSPVNALQSCLNQPITVCVSPGATPADNCPDFCVYCALNGKIGSTAGYTSSGPPVLCSQLENDQWLGFMANTTTATFTVTPSNCSQGQGLQIALLPECGFAPLACNSGSFGGGNLPRSVTYGALQIGKTYVLMIDGYNGDECDFVINVSPSNAIEDCSTPPSTCLTGVTPMETCMEACLGCSIHLVTGTTAGASGEPVPGFCDAVENDQWLAFQVDNSSTSIQISPTNCANNDGLQAAIFPQCGFVPLVCNDGTAGGGNTPLTLTAQFVPGKTYWLMIDGYNGDECDFTISVSPQPQPSTAENCPEACLFCNLNGYFGSTDGFAGGFAAGFCGTIENEQWFSFFAGASSATFTATSSNCILGNGVQIALYSDCNGVPVPNGCNMGCAGCADTPASITVSLTPDVNYYLLIDGYAGDVCDFILTINPQNAIACAPPLPVELISFDAIFDANTQWVDLTWATVLQIDLDYFDLQRSSDGIVWSTLSRIEGSQSASAEYQAVDPHPFIGSNYYRLHMVDIDGTESYSVIRRVEIDKGSFTVRCYSDGKTNTGNFYIESKEEEILFDVCMYDVYGRKVLTWSNIPAGKYTFPMDHFPAGMYLIEVVAETGRITTRLIWP